MTQTNVQERFWAKIQTADHGECWEWRASKDRGGDGRFNAGGGVYWSAHRYAYVDMVGEIPEGLELDHLCRNRGCVNPYHLEPVTRGENIRRSDNFAGRYARATHCGHGHEFTPENTVLITHGGYTTRRCRTCQTETSRRACATYRAKKKAERLASARK